MKRHFPLRLVKIVFLLSGVLCLRTHGQSLGFRTQHDGRCYRVAVTLDGEDILTSPVEGLWSIATDWKDSWPAAWVHAGPTEIERTGKWTILRGKLET